VISFNSGRKTRLTVVSAHLHSTTREAKLKDCLSFGNRLQRLKNFLILAHDVLPILLSHLLRSFLVSRSSRRPSEGRQSAECHSWRCSSEVCLDLRCSHDFRGWLSCGTREQPNQPLIATSRTPPWLLSRWGCRGRRLSRGLETLDTQFLLSLYRPTSRTLCRVEDGRVPRSES
jgi:hypothetical protein